MDRRDISSVSLASLRSQLGVVGQEPVLFDRTIAENIAYGDNYRLVPMDEIIEAAKKSNIHSFVSSLPLVRTPNRYTLIPDHLTTNKMGSLKIITNYSLYSILYALYPYKFHIVTSS